MVAGSWTLLMIFSAVGITAEKVSAFGVSIEMTKVWAFVPVPSDGNRAGLARPAGPVVEAEAGPCKVGQAWAGATGIGARRGGRDVEIHACRFGPVRDPPACWCGHDEVGIAPEPHDQRRRRSACRSDRPVMRRRSARIEPEVDIGPSHLAGRRCQVKLAGVILIDRPPAARDGHFHPRHEHPRRVGDRPWRAGCGG